MGCGCSDTEENGVPILRTTQCVEIDETPQTLEDAGIVFNDATTCVRILPEGRWRLKPLGRYSRDPSASITADIGAPIYPRSKICLNENELQSVFRAVSGTLNICVEQYETVPICDFQAQYRVALAQLLPIGYAWEAKSVPDSVLYRLLNCVGKLASDLHCRALQLVDEFFPSSCRELCANWAAEAFDNDIQLCLQGIELTQAQEIEAIVAKLIASGSIRTADYQLIAEALGLDVVITEDFANKKIIFDIIGADVTPMTACDLTCSRLYDGPDMNFILAFRCIMQKIKRLGIDHEYRIDGAC